VGAAGRSILAAVSSSRMLTLRPARTCLRLADAATGHMLLIPVLLLVGLAYAGNLRNPLFGSDTWPWLASSRVSSPGDVVTLAFSPIMPGTQFLAEVARFYRPLAGLSYALDLALFGLNPFALYATNLGIHLLGVGAVYSLARGLHLSPWAAAVSALVLGLHPIAAATVPNLARHQDLVVAPLLVGSMSLLVRARIGADHTRWRFVAGSLALYFLALGGKEVAYAALAVVPYLLAFSWLAERDVTPSGRRPRLARAAWVLAAFVAVEAVGFAIRWQVLGGLGGYYGTEVVRGRLDGVVEYFVRPYVTDMLWPFQALLPDRLRDWLLALGAVGVMVGIGVAALPRLSVLVVALGLAWQASFLLLYVVAHTSLSAYLLYVPLVGLALIVGAILDGAVRLLARLRGPDQLDRVSGGRAGVAAIAAAVFVAGVVRSSALVTAYPEWADAGFVSERFLAQALPCFAAAQGPVVQVADLPYRIDYGTRESTFVDAYVFEPYSLDSAIRLLLPGTRVGLQVLGQADVHGRPRDVQVTCTAGPGGWRLSPSVTVE